MSMIKKSILPLSIFVFEAADSMLDHASEAIEKLDWTGNVLNERSTQMLNALPEFEHLHLWFADCLEKVRADLKLPFERLVISQSWATKTQSGEAHHRHTHPNSYVSGVFYLTSAVDGKTEFFRKDYWYDFFLCPLSNLTQRVSCAESAVAGRLLIFPSNLEHKVAVYRGDFPRFTIAFNVFPEGNFGSTETSNFLNIKVLPYQDPG
jgi:uncharacterized protein (TIGR02466 family)